MLDAGGHIVLSDFGLARERVSTAGSRSICGSPSYMAPEVRRLATLARSHKWLPQPTCSFGSVAPVAHGLEFCNKHSFLSQKTFSCAVAAGPWPWPRRRLVGVWHNAVRAARRPTAFPLARTLSTHPQHPQRSSPLPLQRLLASGAIVSLLSRLRLHRARFSRVPLSFSHTRRSF